jgi:hypothetical protein
VRGEGRGRRRGGGARESRIPAAGEMEGTDGRARRQQTKRTKKQGEREKDESGEDTNKQTNKQNDQNWGAPPAEQCERERKCEEVRRALQIDGGTGLTRNQLVDAMQIEVLEGQLLLRQVHEVGVDAAAKRED